MMKHKHFHNCIWLSCNASSDWRNIFFEFRRWYEFNRTLYRVYTKTKYHFNYIIISKHRLLIPKSKYVFYVIWCQQFRYVPQKIIHQWIENIQTNSTNSSRSGATDTEPYFDFRRIRMNVSLCFCDRTKDVLHKIKKWPNHWIHV